jgi:uncharacterized protein YbjT (DUF2867 family)
MKILVCGGHGFIGAAVVQKLRRAGHTVYRGVRRVQGEQDIRFDYSDSSDSLHWRKRVEGFDAVINAVGILVERRGQSFDAIHRRAPCALFEACLQAGVGRVIQVSALGADCS